VKLMELERRQKDEAERIAARCQAHEAARHRSPDSSPSHYSGATLATVTAHRKIGPNHVQLAGAK
jgi:hypothetical protein